MKGWLGCAFSGVWGYKVKWVRIAGALYWCPSENYLGIFCRTRIFGLKMNTCNIATDLILHGVECKYWREYQIGTK